MRLLRWLAFAAIVVPAIAAGAAEPLRVAAPVAATAWDVTAVHPAPHARASHKHAVVRGAAVAPARTSISLALAIASVTHPHLASPLLARDILLLGSRRNI